MVPSSTSDVALKTMKGRKTNDEKIVFKNNTGITAFPFSACFFN
jgi:hypothetical protein